MFVGSVPAPVVDQILRTVEFDRWRNVFVCCSGERLDALADPADAGA